MRLTQIYPLARSNFPLPRIIRIGFRREPAPKRTGPRPYPGFSSVYRRFATLHRRDTRLISGRRLDSGHSKSASKVQNRLPETTNTPESPSQSALGISPAGSQPRWRPASRPQDGSTSRPQDGSTWDARGRQFKSARPDQYFLCIRGPSQSALGISPAGSQPRWRSASRPQDGSTSRPQDGSTSRPLNGLTRAIHCRLSLRSCSHRGMWCHTICR